MRKFAVSIVLCLILQYVAGCVQPSPTPQPVPLPDEPQPTPQVLMYFCADNCAPCRKMEQDTFDNPTVQARMLNLTFVKRRDREGIRSHNVTSFPTYILFSGGTELRRSSGYRGPTEFLQWLNP